MTVGNRIQNAREVLGVTQKELAHEVGVQPDTMRAYEADRRRPPYETMMRIAHRTGVDLRYLLGETDTYNEAEVEAAHKRTEKERAIETMKQAATAIEVAAKKLTALEEETTVEFLPYETVELPFFGAIPAHD